MQPTLIGLLTLSPTLFGVVALLWQTQPHKAARTIKLTRLPNYRQRRLVSGCQLHQRLCSALRSLPFVVGYIAARTTKTVGWLCWRHFFHLSTSSVWLPRRRCFCKQGGLTPTLRVSAQYAESACSDAAKGKAIANSMYSDGLRRCLPRCGRRRTGVIEAAKDANKLAIGVDRDQAYLAQRTF